MDNLIEQYSELLDNIVLDKQKDNTIRCMILAKKLGRNFTADLIERKQWLYDSISR